MQKERHYSDTRFSAEVLRVATQALDALGDKSSPYYLSADFGYETWRHDSLEEFFADYSRADGDATYHVISKAGSIRLQTFESMQDVQVAVTAPTRAGIATIFNVFDKHLAESQVQGVPSREARPRIFVGHGHSDLWRQLKDHLQDKHGLQVVAYEIGARAGHTVRDVLQDMLRASTFAILVMTGEDETVGGSIHPRLNVVHEAGLFQGKLGFSRAIILLEDGTEEFSNIHGLEQVRFAPGNIKETFGEVVATIRREFPGAA